MRKLLLLFVLLLTGCQQENIKIGYSNTLSGPFNSLGIETLYGVQLAVEEYNAKGGNNGRQIELLIKDDEASTELAVQVDNELIEEGVVAIIGHGLSKVAEAVITNIENQEIVMLSPTMSTNVYSNIDDKFVRIIPGAETQGEELCRITLEEGGSVTLVAEENNKAYSGPVMQSFLNCYTNDVDIIQYESSDPNSYQAMVEQTMELDNNNVVLINSSRDVVNMEFIFKNNGYSSKLFLSTWGTTDELLAIGGNQVSEIYGVGYYFLNSAEEQFIELKNRYETRYGSDINFSVLFGYESAMTLFDALSRADADDYLSIKDSLISHDYDGIMNDFEINEYGDAVRSIYKIKLENGSFNIDD